MFMGMECRPVPGARLRTGPQLTPSQVTNGKQLNILPLQMFRAVSADIAGDRCVRHYQNVRAYNSEWGFSRGLLQMKAPEGLQIPSGCWYSEIASDLCTYGKTPRTIASVSGGRDQDFPVRSAHLAPIPGLVSGKPVGSFHSITIIREV